MFTVPLLSPHSPLTYCRLRSQKFKKILNETVVCESGAVIQEGLNTVAVFRDAEGELHRYSAVCPHLGCAVKWNPKDSTFDCPCHGSQFDTNGVCIQSPAGKGLDKLVTYQN